MKRLHIFIAKAYIAPLIATFFIAMFILLMQFLWKYIDDLVGKGLEWTIIAELLTYASASLFQMALPLSILLSSIMTFGTLGENNELLALKASGISLQKIMAPLVVLTIAISIFAFMFSNYVLPYTNLKTGSLLFDIRHQRPELNIKEGSFNNDIDGYIIKIGKKNSKTNMMYDFMLYDHTNHKGNTNVTIADSASMYVTRSKKHMVLTMYNGNSYEEIKKDRKRKQNYKPHRQSSFDKQMIFLELKGFEFEKTNDDLFKHNYQMKGLTKLSLAIDSLNLELDKRNNNFSKSLLRINYFKRSKLKKAPKLPETLSKNNKPHSEIDSLNKNIIGTETKEIAQKVTKTDIIDKPIVYKEVNIDSIYSLMTADEIVQTNKMAIKFGENAKSYITNTQDDLKNRIMWIRKHQVEWHRKFTLSFACFILFFIGAPLGAIIRKGGFGMPVVISISLFIAYYIISLMGEKFVREDVIPDYIGMWLSSAIILPLGIFLTYKATTDSVIFNIGTYRKVFNIIANLIDRNKNM